MKPVLMIHDFKREYLNLPLKDYTLTFDDGLVSPLAYWDELSKIPTEKIFFVITSAFELGFEGRPTTDFLTIEDIAHIRTCAYTRIGAHSHAHRHVREIPSMVKRIEHIRKDTEIMLDWFAKYLNFQPNAYCLPYNEDDVVYRLLLREYGFTEIYGSERIDIERLCHEDRSRENPYIPRY